jgi:hypothetical protein
MFLRPTALLPWFRPVRHAFSAGAFERALEDLCSRERRFDGELARIDGLRHRRRIAKDLAASVADGTYQASPGRLQRVWIEGKERVLMKSTLVDAVVDRATGQWLARTLEPQLPAALFSYRKGRGPLDAWRRLAKWIDAYNAAYPDPRTRALWVLRRDVRSYGDNIPVSEDSPLWTMLDEALQGAPATERRIGLFLLRDLVPRLHVADDGEVRRLTCGTPTGSSIQPAINNLYLSALDHEMSDLGFYVRFGDDIAFVTEDRSVAEQAERVLDAHLVALRLEWKAEKSRRIYLTGAGHPGPDGWLGASEVELLGLSITARGNLRLPNEKFQRAYDDLARRLGRIAHDPVFATMDVEGRARLLCESLRVALDGRDLCAIRDAHLLGGAVHDRGQLRDLDARLRLRVAALSTGRPGPRAYRALPPRRLIDLGFPSLVHRQDIKPRMRR